MSEMDCVCPNNQGWDIYLRDDNQLAVQKCDTCEILPDDEAAAKKAQIEGILCEPTYPCFVIEEK